MAHDFLSEYRLIRSKDLRDTLKPDYIIVNQSYDFLREFDDYSPEIIYDDMKPKHHLFLKLSKTQHGHDTDFSHFYIELIRKNYTRIAGLAQRYTSPFIRDLTEKNIINNTYLNSMLVTIVGNYSEDGGDIVPKEVYNHLGYLLADLTRMHRLSRSRIVLLEDIVNHNNNEKLGLKKYNFEKTRIEKGVLDMYVKKF